MLTTFEELAAKYVQQMRVRQPTGPVLSLWLLLGGRADI